MHHGGTSSPECWVSPRGFPTADSAPDEDGAIISQRDKWRVHAGRAVVGKARLPEDAFISHLVHAHFSDVDQQTSGTLVCSPATRHWLNHSVGSKVRGCAKLELGDLGKSAGDGRSYQRHPIQLWAELELAGLSA